MQIRSLSLKELQSAYELVRLRYPLSYDDFENLVYEMRQEYTMLGVFIQEKIRAFAGVTICTTLRDGRHVRVFELIAYEETTKEALRSYIEDFAKVAAAPKVIYEE